MFCTTSANCEPQMNPTQPQRVQVLKMSKVSRSKYMKGMVSFSARSLKDLGSRTFQQAPSWRLPKAFPESCGQAASRDAASVKPFSYGRCGAVRLGCAAEPEMGKSLAREVPAQTPGSLIRTFNSFTTIGIFIKQYGI